MDAGIGVNKDSFDSETLGSVTSDSVTMIEMALAFGRHLGAKPGRGRVDGEPFPRNRPRFRDSLAQA
jgi:hypothetical protein